ncbi:hypothetical protein OIU79_007785 [Salix purpurea]|uniref:Uncharacterized protein n=1 Tax=Salix purpurea TaxID=77065 RepID=A0A9Q0YVE8_SALPP|nr:hypothetical protein OIU79_007785 [Salix purpurea]
MQAQHIYLYRYARVIANFQTTSLCSKSLPKPYNIIACMLKSLFKITKYF